MEILGSSQQTMEAALQVRSARAELLAANVANADTPGYQSRDLNFDGALTSALADPTSASGSSATVAPENIRFDHNDVDVSQQLGRAYENSLDYVATLKLYGDSLGRIKAATGT